MPQPASIEPLHPTAQNLTAPSGGLASYPPVERWDDWEEYDPKAWPRSVERRYQLVPTICFNCEAACGLLAYVDKERLTIQKFEGNPEHPGSRGRNCAKGPATLNQIEDPERIRYPAEARRAAGRGPVGARQLGRGARRHRGAHPEGARRGAAQRGDVPRRPARPRARLPPADPAGLGDRRAQLAHQRLLGLGARRLRVLERPRPALARTTPTPASSCSSPRTSRPATTSTRTPSGSSRRRSGAPRSARSTRASPTRRRWPTAGCRPWPGTEAALLLAVCQLIIAERRYDRGVPAPLGELGRVPPRGASGQAADVRDLRGGPRRRSTPSSRPRSPRRSPAFRRRPSRRSPARSRGPAPRSRPTSGGTRRRATSAAGRSRGPSSS